MLFLVGCAAGTLVTSLLYFSTCYTEIWTRDLGERAEGPTLTAEMAAGQRDRVQNHLSLVDSGAYSSVFLASARNFVLPVVFTSRNGIGNALYSVNSTWGAQREDWSIAVGTKGARITSSVAHDHLLLMQRCEDFDGVALSAKALFCLLTSLHETHLEHYQWFLIAHTSTYVALNRLIEILVELDSSQVAYIGRRSSHSVPEMNKLSLLSHEHICKLDSGIVLSRAALRRVVPHLQHCVGYGLSRGFAGPGGLLGEVELGRCFSRRLDITCSESVEEKLHVSMGGLGIIIRLYYMCILQAGQFANRACF